MNNDQALTRVDVKTYLSGREVASVQNITNDSHSNQIHKHQNAQNNLPKVPVIVYHHQSTNRDINNTTKLETSNRININKPEVTLNRRLASSISEIQVKLILINNFCFVSVLPSITVHSN